MGWLTSLLGFLDKLFAFINTQEIKQAGRNEVKLETMEADNEARKNTKEIKKNVANLDADSVVVKLHSKYKRK